MAVQLLKRGFSPQHLLFTSQDVYTVTYKIWEEFRNKRTHFPITEHLYVAARDRSQDISSYRGMYSPNDLSTGEPTKTGRTYAICGTSRTTRWQINIMIAINCAILSKLSLLVQNLNISVSQSIDRTLRCDTICSCIDESSP